MQVQNVKQASCTGKKMIIGFIRPQINPLTPHLEKALKI
jgi:hypothetical protein